jgi:hypothetical protein
MDPMSRNWKKAFEGLVAAIEAEREARKSGINREAAWRKVTAAMAEPSDDNDQEVDNGS